MTRSESKFYDYNFSYFDNEINKEGFICAGIRDNIIGMYNLLVSKGANPVDSAADRLKISSRKPIVLLCFNSKTSFENLVIGSVQIMSRQWWDYYHNKKHKCNNPIYKTYNLPSQWNKVLMEGCVWKDVETINPE